MDDKSQGQSEANVNDEKVNYNLPTDQPLKPVKDNTKLKFLKNRRALIGLIIAAIVILLGVGATLVYSLWYQNPEKIVFDSISNTIKAKSTKVTGDFNVAFNGDDEFSNQGIDNVQLSLTENGDISSFDLDAKLTVDLTDMEDSLALNGNAIMDNDGNIYFNISNIEDTVDKFVAYTSDNCMTSYAGYYDEETLTAECNQYGSLKETFSPIISTIDNQWWKISADDLSELDEDWGKEQQCLTELANKINDDKKIHNEIIDLYKKNPFINIDKELGLNGGSYGFEIGLDSKSAVSFINNLNETTLYKELSTCSDRFEASEDIDEDDISDYSTLAEDNGSLVLWVSQFNHEISKIEANYKDDAYDFSTNITTMFNEPYTLETPSDSKPISELVEAIQEVFGEMY